MKPIGNYQYGEKTPGNNYEMADAPKIIIKVYFDEADPSQDQGIGTVPLGNQATQKLPIHNFPGGNVQLNRPIGEIRGMSWDLVRGITGLAYETTTKP